MYWIQTDCVIDVIHRKLLRNSVLWDVENTQTQFQRVLLYQCKGMSAITQNSSNMKLSVASTITWKL